MAVQTTTALPAQPARNRSALGAARRATVRILRSIHDLWDGSSFDPGRHPLTWVQAPSDRQTPR